jgi:hypothetical protein
MNVTSAVGTRTGKIDKNKVSKKHMVGISLPMMSANLCHCFIMKKIHHQMFPPTPVYSSQGLYPQVFPTASVFITKSEIVLLYL